MSSRSIRHSNNAQWKKLRQRILARDNYTCYLCGNEATTVDHIQPISRGGTDDEWNLASACTRCNYSKQDRVVFLPGRSTAPIPRRLDFPETESKSHD